jgi:hypothetical protein
MENSKEKRPTEQGSAEAGAQEVVKICPRCGQPYSYLSSCKSGSRVYYFAAHYEGYEEVDGRVRRKVRKCYLGPRTYPEKPGSVKPISPMDEESLRELLRWVEQAKQAKLSPIASLELSTKLVEGAIQFMRMLWVPLPPIIDLLDRRRSNELMERANAAYYHLNQLRDYLLALLEE